MIAKAQFKMGDATYSFEVEEKDTKDTLSQIITLSNPPRKCDVCKTEGGKYLYTNRDKGGNVYIKVSCPCGAQAKLGSYKTRGYFWHVFVKYVPEGNANNSEII